jgi:hypothetical protein
MTIAWCFYTYTNVTFEVFSTTALTNWDYDATWSLYTTVTNTNRVTITCTNAHRFFRVRACGKGGCTSFATAEPCN